MILLSANNIMSSQPTTSFKATLSSFRHQGALLSSFAPLRVEEYLRPPLLPPRSSYHLVTCPHPRLLARAHTHSILNNYLTASTAPNSPIIDLCLPFHDEASRRTYLSRYIIFRGAIVGLRLSTRVGGLAPEFSSWPRHRATTAAIKAQSKVYTIPIGEIALYLGNVRIGLLSDLEVETAAQEYINCGFDLIALAYTEGGQEKRAIEAAVGGLARETAVLQGGASKERQEGIQGMLFGPPLDNSPRKSRIHISYYSFERIFASKSRLPLSEKQPLAITPVEIDHSFLQENLPIVPIDNLHYELIPKRYSQTSKPSTSQLDVYLQRLYLFHRRSGGRRIVVMLQDTPTALIFLYILNLILKEKQIGESLPFRRIFKFVSLHKAAIAKLFPKLNKLRLQIADKAHKQLKSGEKTSKLIKALDFLAKSEQKQSFFPVITGQEQTVNVLRMINQRESLKQQEGDFDQQAEANEEEDSESSCTCVTQLPSTTQTWVATSFFTESQLKSLYFSKEVKEIMNDEEWHRKLWERQCVKNKKGQQADEAEERVLDIIEEKCLSQAVKIQDFLQRNCPLMREFQRHHTLLRQRASKDTNHQICFAHFLFRKLTKIDIIPSSSLLKELLNTSQGNLFSTYCFLHSRKLSPTAQLTSRTIKNQLALARLEAERKIQCHACEGRFQSELMFVCEVVLCGQHFCYDCLMGFEAYSPQQLIKKEEDGKKGRPREVKLCPICRGLCSDCGRCTCKREQMRLQSHPHVNATQEQCHYCRSPSHLLLFRCKQCPERFCLVCIQQVFRLKGREHEKSAWACFVCQRKCYCNRCQCQKRTMKSVPSKRREAPRKGILKKPSKKTELAKENSQGQDDDEQTKTRMGQPRKQPSFLHS